MTPLSLDCVRKLLTMPFINCVTWSKEIGHLKKKGEKETGHLSGASTATDGVASLWATGSSGPTIFYLSDLFLSLT